MKSKKPSSSDYESFMSGESIDAPEILSKDILHKVRRELKPSHRLVIGKLLFIQGFIGLITLFFCPQFDLSLTGNYSLFHFFHRNFGQNICMAICGGIFLGSGAIFASFILSQAELEKVKNSKLLYYLAMSLIFLTTFMILGVEVYLELAVYWVLGAMLIAIFLFDISSRVRAILRLKFL